MSQGVILSCKGLFTYPNDLGSIPPGSLVDADNIYIDRNDVAQPRRGFKVFTVDAFTTLAKSLHNYQNRLLVHESSNMQYETDPAVSPGVLTTYQESINGILVNATVESPDESSGLKIKSSEVNRNFYFTSSHGIMKIDNVTNSILRSGVPRALDFDLALVEEDGFLLQNNSVAYRVVWGYKDANNNTITSVPSERQTIYYYGLSQFINDINVLLAEIANQAATFTETYPAAIDTTATIDTIYSTMKQIVGALNQETLLTYKEYEAGGNIQINSVTCRPKSVISASSYFIFETNAGRYVPWMNVSGTNTAPNPSLQSDLRLTDTLVEVDFDTVFTRATLTNQTLVYTAVTSGTDGNSITITLTNPGGTNPTLSIAVIGNTINVTLKTTSGTIDTTRSQLVAAFAASVPASALVTVSGSGITTMTALSSTALTGAVGDPNNASTIATLIQTSINGASVGVTMLVTDNNILIRSLYDEDLENAIDGVTATGFTFQNIQQGTELTGAALILTTLQEAFDLIVLNLNSNGAPVTANFVEARTSKSVSLYITIPSDIINLSESGTTFFYQVYRSALFELSDAVIIVPDDELQLVFESNPTSGEITAGFVGPFTDDTSDSFRAQGALLYTNPSQEGIGQANYQPPLAKDVALYKNQLFFSNTINKYNLSLSLITGKESTGPTDPGFTTSSQAVLVNQGVTYTAATYGTVGNSITIRLLNPALTNSPLSVSVIGNAITVSLATNGASAITTTRSQLITAINSSITASALVTASGPVSVTVVTALAATPLATGTTGTVLIFTSGPNSFNLGFVPDTSSDNFEEGIIALIDETAGTIDPSDDLSVGQIIEAMAQKIVKAINRHTDNNFLNAYYSSGFNDLPGQIQFETRFLENSIFTVTSNLTIARNAFSPKLQSPDAVATNDVAVNRVYYSKIQQPEAVPLFNYFDIGAGDKGIIRIIASRDSLFVFKEDGIFTISGQEGESLQVNGLDNTCKIKGPETVVIGNNQVFLFADDGITIVTEAGAKVISQVIDDKVQAFPNTALYSNLNRAAFGVFYDTEKKYYLWLPTDPEDEVATQCFVWNTVTQTWTRLPISKTCGRVNTRDNKLYLGAGDILHLEQERKHFDIFDYADREFTNQIISTSYDDIEEEFSIVLQTVTDIKVGDALQQIEYMRPYYFNRILTLLDTNSLVGTNYYSTLGVNEKSEIGNALITLATKIDTAESDTTYTDILAAIPGSTPAKILERFNALVVGLNVDVNIQESNFPTVDETPQFYTYVIEIHKSNNTVILQDYFDFEVGNITTYQAIDTLITWAPNHAGNPAIWKHFREFNLLFASTICREINIGFASDVSRNYLIDTKTDDSLAGWGIIDWGLKPWGSDAEPRAYRTYIPRVEQRSRYINAQFSHSRAFENYLLNGLSISYDNLTERVTR